MRRFRDRILISIREIVFGLEDGTVSTLGAITGIAGATGNRSIVIVSGFVIVAVESLSMAAGTYLSNKSEARAQNLTDDHPHASNPVRDALIMGSFYIVGGSIPLFPYLIYSVSTALPLSIIAVVIALFIIGATSGKITKVNPIRSGIEMTLVSLSAAALGFVVGKIAAYYFPSVMVQ